MPAPGLRLLRALLALLLRRPAPEAAKPVGKAAKKLEVLRGRRCAFRGARARVSERD
jgi:hypothetical protein